MNMHRSFWMTVLAIALVVAAPAFAQPAFPTIADVEKAWQARQDYVKTLRMEWKEHVVVPRGSVSAMLRGAGSKVPADTPNTDHDYVAPMSMALAGDKLVTETGYQTWNHEKLKFTANPHKIFYNDKEYIVFRPKSDSVDWPIGVKYPLPEQRGVPISLPVLLCVRGCSQRRCGIAPQEFKVSGRSAMVNRVHCIELTYKISHKATYSIWLAPDRDFVPIRMLLNVGATVPAKGDVTYQLDNGIWWPTTWSFVQTEGGRILHSSVSTVVRREVNVMIADHEFECEFPAGTRVVDGSSAKEENYIVREDKSKRPILPREVGKTYQELVNSEPPFTPIQRVTMGRWRWAWGWLGAAGVLLCFVVVRVVLRRRRTQQNA